MVENHEILFLNAYKIDVIPLKITRRVENSAKIEVIPLKITRRVENSAKIEENRRKLKIRKVV